MGMFVRNEDVQAVEMLPGVFRKTLSLTDSMMLCHIRCEGPVPLHQHPHEQIGIVFEGEMELTIGEQTLRLQRGDAYAIPANTPHAARGAGGRPCTVIDIFSPHREEYKTDQPWPESK